jgi:crotonobetainyl-CoA:carnitine CoA-transferase CaiB-like acyl-CoA transferase
MAVNGDERLNPLRCGFPVCDTVGGLNAAWAMMGALYRRERTGRGQFIDVAMIDSIMPLLGWVAANWLIGGKPPQLLGNDNMTAAPSGTFRTCDGHINIAANEQKQWESLCDVLGLAELKTDERFQKRDARKANRKALTPLIEAKLVERPTGYWVDALNAKGVPSGAILSLQDALACAQMAHRGTIQTIEEPGIGPLRLFNLTARFEETPGSLDSPPPRLSAHTEAILLGLGYTADDVRAFRERGVV